MIRYTYPFLQICSTELLSSCLPTQSDTFMGFIATSFLWCGSAVLTLTVEIDLYWPCADLSQPFQTDALFY